MTEYENPEDRNTLGVSHDAEGRAHLTVYPPGEVTMPHTYAIPAHQLPEILIEMAGGAPTEEETEDALTYLGTHNGSLAGMEDLLHNVRVALLALKIRNDAMASVKEAETGVDPEGIDPEAANDAIVLREELNAAYEESEQLRGVINAVANGLAGILTALNQVNGNDGI